MFIILFCCFLKKTSYIQAVVNCIPKVLQLGMFGVCLRNGGSLGEWLEQGFYGAVRVGGEGASGQILGVLEI